MRFSIFHIQHNQNEFWRNRVSNLFFLDIFQCHSCNKMRSLVAFDIFVVVIDLQFQMILIASKQGASNYSYLEYIRRFKCQISHFPFQKSQISTTTKNCHITIFHVWKLQSKLAWNASDLMKKRTIAQHSVNKLNAVDVNKYFQASKKRSDFRFLCDCNHKHTSGFFTKNWFCFYSPVQHLNVSI